MLKGATFGLMVLNEKGPSKLIEGPYQAITSLDYKSPAATALIEGHLLLAVSIFSVLSSTQTS